LIYLSHKLIINYYYKIYRIDNSLQKVKDVVRPYDWTYTTEYSGSYLQLYENNVSLILCLFL